MHCLLYLAFSNINFFNLRIEIISNDLCKAFLAAGIPFNKLQNPILRDVLESNFGLQLPNEATLRLKYLPSCHSNIMESIKEELKEGSLWVTADCSRDTMGREVAHVLIGRLSVDKFMAPYLVKVSFLDKADSATMARYI